MAKEKEKKVKDPPKDNINKVNRTAKIAANKAVATSQRKRGRGASKPLIPKIRKSNSTDSIADSSRISDHEMDSDGSESTMKSANNFKSASNYQNNTKNKPIIIKSKDNNNNIIVLKQKLIELQLTKNYTIKSLRDNQIQIQTQCKEDKAKVVEFLKSNNQTVEYHTFTEKDEKNSMYVLKNHHYLDLNQMLELLKSENVPAISVSFLNNSKTHPSYIVHFEKNSTNLFVLRTQFKVIEHCIIKWEKFDSSKKKISQCHNCQLYGHTAKNCGHQYRCVKCVEIHEPGKCSRTNKSEGTPKCVNCNGDHAANSKQCPKFINYQEYLKKIKKPKVVIRKPEPPRKFQSTPAPWANLTNSLSQSAFPPLVPNNSVNDRLSRLRNSSVFEEEEPSSFDSFAQIQEDFNNIPDIGETVKLFKSLVDKLKSTNCHKTRLSYLIEYTLK